MVVLVIIAVACFVAGVWAATTWLPPLAEDPVATIAYFLICGLAGAVLALFCIRVWGIVRELEESSRLNGSSRLVASLVAYLLAPKAQDT
jgi:peptidoglycan/LPS O-acetylase OafA/YrhL